MNLQEPTLSINANWLNSSNAALMCDFVLNRALTACAELKAFGLDGQCLFEECEV